MLRKVVLVLGLVAAMIACGGGGGSSPTQNKTTPPSGATGTVVVQVNDDFFSPKSVQISPGQTVQWMLVGKMTNHTVTDTGGAFDSGFLSMPGATFSHTFTDADGGKTFNYLCRTHGALGMKGDVRVGDNAPSPGAGY